MQTEIVQEQTYEIIQGDAIFESTVDLQLIKSEKIKHELSGEQWRIWDRVYSNYNWKNVFQHMKECFVIKLWLNTNQNPQIIIQIKHVNFRNLTFLNLFRNNISNIEALSTLNCPNLSFLNLGINNINQIKSLNKMLSSSLSELLIYQNPLNQAYSLVRQTFNSKILKSLYLQYYQYDLLIQEDLSFLVKINSKQFQKYSRLSPKGIHQTKVYRLLRARFENIKSFYQ